MIDAPASAPGAKTGNSSDTQGDSGDVNIDAADALLTMARGAGAGAEDAQVAADLGKGEEAMVAAAASAAAANAGLLTTTNAEQSPTAQVPPTTEATQDQTAENPGADKPLEDEGENS